MTPAWYERMNPRERILAWIVAGALIVLLNLVIWNWLFGALATARAQLATRQAARAEHVVYIKDWSIFLRFLQRT